MGKGDKKTRRGKIIKGSYGKVRPRKKKTSKQAIGVVMQQTAKPEKKTKVKNKQEVASNAAHNVVQEQESVSKSIELSHNETVAEQSDVSTGKNLPEKEPDEIKEKKSPSKKSSKTEE